MITIHSFGIVAQTGPHSATVFLAKPRTCVPCQREVMLLMLDIDGSRCPSCPATSADLSPPSSPHGSAAGSSRVLHLPVPRTPQTAEDMCEALQQSIERVRK